MKKLLLAVLVFLFMSVNAFALSFTDEQTLNKIIGEGPLAQMKWGDTFEYSHNTPADFQIPGSILNSATLTLTGYWIDSFNNEVEVENTVVGTLVPGGDYWTTTSWVWNGWWPSLETTVHDYPSYSVFDVSAVFAGGWAAEVPLNVQVTTNGNWGDWKLKLGTSTLVMDYQAVPEPVTLLLLGAGVAGLALYRRRSVNK